MSDHRRLGVIYTEYARLSAGTPIVSLWSYESKPREAGRPPILSTADGRHEYWLERSDPLLNTILPATLISVVVNLGDAWAAGRTLITTDLVPGLCVVGPVTRPQLLRVGQVVQSVGAVLPATLAGPVFGCAPGDLVDRIVPLDGLWRRERVDGLYQAVSRLNGATRVAALKDALMTSATSVPDGDATVAAAQVITRRGGRLSIEGLAASHGLSRQQFARRFRAATGLAPKQFARLSRFQRLVQTLLLTDVESWALEAPALGFYDQAHMINEFREFAGQPPTRFFLPHRENVPVAAELRLRGRPHEWLRFSRA